MKLNFRLAKKEDLDNIFNMFTSAIKEMERNNIHQWDELYPDKDILEEDLLKNELYISTYDDKIVSAYVLNKECDEEYKNGSWQYPDSTYCVIHRLCVNPEFQNKGVGTLTMKHIESKVKDMDVQCIRLDTFTLNPYSLKMYKKLGYSKVGIVEWRKGQFYLMEKKL